MSAVGKRYAQALMAGLGTADAEKVLADLEAFGAWRKEVPALERALENPGVPAASKVKLVNELVSRSGIEPVAGRFMQMAVANRRTRQWDELVAAYRALCDERRGVVRARVRTARPLPVEVVRDLASRLGKALGSRVELESGVSPELLGGMEVRLGSTVYDGTVSGALKALHQDLVKG